MGSSLRILSTNLWYGRAEADALRALLERWQPDVVAAQELGHDCADVIAECMPHGLLEPREDHRGMGMATRHPAELVLEPPEGRPLRVARLRPEDWPELSAPLEVVNIHISAPHSAMDGFPLTVRNRQVRALEHYLDTRPAPHRAVVGDYNATPVWPAYRRLTRRLRDAAVEVAQREGLRPRRTWGPTSGAPRLLRIDHALTEGLHCHAFEVLDVPGSDHSAIVLDVTPERPAAEAQKPTRAA